MTEKRSDKIEQLIDDEAMGIITDAYNDTLKLIRSKKQELDSMANRLLEKEVLMEEDVNDILGKRPEN